MLESVYAMGEVNALGLSLVCARGAWTVGRMDGVHLTSGWNANDNLMYRIQTWALEEARRRLEAEGILKDPQNKK